MCGCVLRAHLKTNEVEMSCNIISVKIPYTDTNIHKLVKKPYISSPSLHACIILQKLDWYISRLPCVPTSQTK